MEKQIKTASIVFCGAQLFLKAEEEDASRTRQWFGNLFLQEEAGADTALFGNNREQDWAAHAEPPFHQADALKV